MEDIEILVLVTIAAEGNLKLKPLQQPHDKESTRSPNAETHAGMLSVLKNSRDGKRCWLY